MASWTIDSKGLRDKWRSSLGDEQYELRSRVAAEKVAQFADSEYDRQTVIGGQFEALAMQCPQHIFDKLCDKDYRFWYSLVLKVCGV